MRSTIAVALALAAGAQGVAVEAEHPAHVFGKNGAGVYRGPAPPPPRLGKDDHGVYKGAELDAKTIAAKFAWYVEQFEKTYDIEEYADRLKAFARTLKEIQHHDETHKVCLLYTSPSPRDKRQSRMPSSA